MAALNVVPKSFLGEPADVVYLGISGVLHPSESTYNLVMRRSPWEDGHAKYESVSVLERALAHWPKARIVLTATMPWRHQPRSVLCDIGPALAARVIGYTFEDLTKKACVLVTGRNGLTRQRSISEEEYWRLRKSEVVLTHVQWLRPRQWIAVDDDDILWPADARRDRLVATDACLGLQEKVAEHRLLMLLMNNFGDPDVKE